MPNFDPVNLFAAVPLVVVLGWFLYQRHRAAVLRNITDARRESSEMVSRAVLIDGSRHIPVSLALDQSRFFYENDSLKASIERKWIHEVEYENELTTGQSIGDGVVLRLRCFSNALEFIIEKSSAAAWKAALPAHHAA